MSEEPSIKSFSRLIETLADGDAHAEASKLLHELGEALQDEALASNVKVRGKLTLTLTISAEPNGIAEVNYELKAVKPAPRRPKTILWQTKSGDFTAHNPRQQKLPLHEVTVLDRSAAKEV
jgi:hypothetical protein